MTDRDRARCVAITSRKSSYLSQEEKKFLSMVAAQTRESLSPEEKKEWDAFTAASREFSRRRGYDETSD